MNRRARRKAASQSRRAKGTGSTLLGDLKRMKLRGVDFDPLYLDWAERLDRMPEEITLPETDTRWATLAAMAATGRSLKVAARNGKRFSEWLGFARVGGIGSHLRAMEPDMPTLNPVPSGAACRSGCHACCVFPKAIAATDFEVWEVFEAIKGGSDGRTYHPKACPALNPDTRKCGAYRVRPAVCRGHYAPDPVGCEAGGAFTQTPVGLTSAITQQVLDWLEGCPTPTPVVMADLKTALGALLDGVEWGTAIAQGRDAQTAFTTGALQGAAE